MTHRPATSLGRALIAGAAAGAILVAATVPFLGRYGWDRDELYFMSASHHLALGYVDFPPVTAWVAWLVGALRRGFPRCLAGRQPGVRGRDRDPGCADGARAWRWLCGAVRRGRRLGADAADPRARRASTTRPGSTSSPGWRSYTSRRESSFDLNRGCGRCWASWRASGSRPSTRSCSCLPPSRFACWYLPARLCGRAVLGSPRESPSSCSCRTSFGRLSTAGRASTSRRART